MKQFLLIILTICSSLAVFGQDETECTQTLSGEVRDGITTDVLTGAEVILTDGEGDIVETQTIKEDGAFSFTIKCGAAYKIEGIQEEYTAESKSFTSTNEDKRELKLIILLDKGNIDFVTDGQANAKAIDTVATADVVAPEVVTPEIAVEEIKRPEVTPEIVVDEIEKPVVEEKEVPSKEIASGMNAQSSVSVKIDPVYFDYESSWLNEKKRKQLLKVVKMLRENPKLVLKCSGFTDAKGDEKYNQWMSDRRAKRVVDFIVSKGISSSRISGKGYGETNLVNDCTNEKECTDEERADNRRTEFVIVRM